MSEKDKTIRSGYKKEIDNCVTKSKDWEGKGGGGEPGAKGIREGSGKQIP